MIFAKKAWLPVLWAGIVLSSCKAQTPTLPTVNLFSRFDDRFNFNFAPPNISTTSSTDGESPPAEGRQSAGFPDIPFPGFPFATPPSPTNLQDVDVKPCPGIPICPATKSRTYRPDGKCNNPIDGSRGSTGHPIKRLLPPDYADKKGAPRVSSTGGALPTARVVSTTMQDTIPARSTKFTQELPFWGQYIIHDVVSTPSSSRPSGVSCHCGNQDPACFNIPVGFNDIQFIAERKRCLPVVRSQPIQDAHCSSEVRQQLNEVTSFIDASTVYGSEADQLHELRDQTSRTGELKEGLRPLPPHSLPKTDQMSSNFQQMACPVAVHKPKNTACFAAGDSRANEHQGLASHHTLFLRLHNDIVTGLSQRNRHWDKNRVFETARSIVAAVHQFITYGQFLPVVLGETYMKRFDLELVKKGYWYGYDASYDATVANSFAAAAFRFGHTLVSGTLTRYSSTWRPTGPSLSLKDSFFNNEPLLSNRFGGASSVFRGMSQVSSLKFDTTFTNDMHNFLFAPEGQFGHDLLAINIQRGREHGLPSYNEYRALAGLRKAQSFDDLTEISSAKRFKLKQLYKRVDDIDLYMGALSENSVTGGVVGPTFAYLIGHQFRDLRKGDSFWFENGAENTVFTPAQIKEIRKMTLSRITCDHMSGTRTIQPNPFLQPTVPGNSRKSCSSYPAFSLNPWRESAADALDKETESVNTQWFPLTTEDGKKVDPLDLLDVLLVNRPEDVCARVLGSERRTVRGKEQIRYKCPPGAIKASPYPPADVKMGVWSDWVDSSTPSFGSGDDDESRGKLNACKGPIAIQAQTTRGVPARETGDVFRKFSPRAGLLCKGSDQLSNRCQDYRVRYLCKEIIKGPILDPSPTTTPAVPTQYQWTPWISQSNPNFGNGDQEFLYTLFQRVGFCPRPKRIEARDVVTRLDSSQTGDSFQFMSPLRGLYCLNSLQASGQCRDYEVRYLCEANTIVKPQLTPHAQSMKNQLCAFYQTCCG